MPRKRISDLVLFDAHGPERTLEVVAANGRSEPILLDAAPCISVGFHWMVVSGGQRREI
jgi:hypothetical protein